MVLRLRILPLTMAFTLMLLAVKTADIIRGSEDFSHRFLVPSVGAQAEKTDTIKPDPLAASATPAPPAEDVSTHVKAEGAEEDGAEKMGLAESAKKGSYDVLNKQGIKIAVRPPEEIDTTKGGATDVRPENQLESFEEGKPQGGQGLGPGMRYFSPIEMEILQTLAKRREALVKWEKDVEVKENLLSNVEKRVDEKLVTIEGMKKDLETMLTQYNDQEDTKIKSLVKIYEAMKPRDAARIFDEVEMPVLLLVIDKMAEKKAAPILAQMDPKKAKQITVELAEARRVQGGKLAAARGAATTSAPVQAK